MLFRHYFREFALAYLGTQATVQRRLRPERSRRLRLLATSALLLCLSSQSARGATPEAPVQADSLLQHAPPTARQPLIRSALGTLPLLVIGAGYSLYNEPVRSLRHAHIPSLRTHYDDYLQFAPLATMLSMSALGIEGSSKSRGQMLLGNAIAYGSMLGLVHLGKRTTGVLRPDGSAHNSFPSGHTAMAFTAATLLHAEYGGRYPWLSALGYASATAVGVGRMLNNRHWVGDVVTGAALGYMCGILGYWLSDSLLGTERSSDFLHNGLISDGSLSLYLPIRYAPAALHHQNSAEGSVTTTALGIGVQWVYSPKGYYITGEFAPSLHEVTRSEGFEAHRALALSAGWGRELPLWKQRIYLGIGSHIQVDTPLSSPQKTAQHPSLTTTLIPKLMISPRWHLTSRLGFSLDISGGYQITTGKYNSNFKQLNGALLELGSSLWLVI